MSFNVAEGVQLAINTFGGLITEVPPSNVPESGSPDNQDCQFWPGAVGSRDGLRRVFENPFSIGSPGIPGTVTYAKSYVDPLGIIRNLYLDSDGQLWVENVTSSAGTYTLLTTTVPGSYAKSITAFGREYIAISDGLHGSDIPLQYDGTNLDKVTQDGPGTPPTIESTVIAATLMAPSGMGFSMVRGFDHPNVVEVTTAAPHGLQVGYQALIADVPAGPVNFIDEIVINNDDLPGIATVTVSAPHGLKPGTFVILRDISAESIGTSLVSATREGGNIIFGTSTAHNLSPGAVIVVAGNTDNTFNTFFTVATILDPVSFTAFQNEATNATGTGGTVSIAWPISSTEAAPAYFEVLAVPTTTTFQVAVTYSSGIWTTGAVFFPWNGTFFVTEVPTTTTFRYQQYGPDAATTDIGTVTPHGQVAPGEHQMQVLFLTRQGYTTKPSPPVKFIANGGQYLTVSDIPIGPANVQARILAFTGARGAAFYYIPVPAMVNGQRVSTATQIDDNTTTSVVLDFSDNTLFAAIGINTLGNNLPAQIILDSALGFTHFGSRLLTYGQRNRIQNLLNMSFDGGYLPSSPTLPTGWIPEGSPPMPGGQLTTSGHYGDAWEITGTGTIYQSFYLDAYGAPIATPRARYTVRAWIAGTGTITLTISSADSGFTTSVTLQGTDADGAWVEGSLSTRMPDMIPEDMILELSGTATAIVDEISIIYRDNPYLDRIEYGSYVNNPEAFDGVSGKFGPANDTRKIMTQGLIRGTLFVLTRDPGGRLHAIIDNGTTEPVGWTINEVATNAGCLSTFGLTVSQADDASGGGGEEWIAWASYSGARIFGGDQPWKISQEIQPDWANINPAASTRIWACNDPYARVIYFGLPIATATAPNLIYPVDYKNLDTAYQIGQSAPAGRGQGGRMVSGEYCRKWTRWNLTMNGAALTYRQPTEQLYITFFAGNGRDPANPGSPPLEGFGNVYILCPDALTDDDFGQISSYYVTYFFPSHQLEAVLGLGSQRKMLEFFQYLAEGVGQLRVLFLCNALDNPWPLNSVRDLSLDPQFDIEHPGGSATGQRIAFKFQSFPVNPGFELDNSLLDGPDVLI